MSEPDIENQVELYEHFFRDPKIGEGAIGPNCSGIACRNIRDALRYLDYSISKGDHFDQELADALETFQKDHFHVHKTAQDGRVGPNTRKLITKVLLQKTGTGFFRRGRISPEYAVFLSYSRKDEGSVGQIASALRNRGIPVFLDKDAIPAGASWPELLHRSIQKCQLFLCALSPNAVASTNVLVEVALAHHSGRLILPVTIERMELPKTFRTLLWDIQSLDLCDQNSPQGGFAVLIEHVANQFGL